VANNVRNIIPRYSEDNSGFNLVGYNRIELNLKPTKDIIIISTNNLLAIVVD
jgi:hypothetical protein